MTTQSELAPAPTRYIPNGLLADVAVQCPDPETGKTGSWLFAGESVKASGARVSPVFIDCYELFQWALRNKWEGIADRWRYAGLTLHGN
jgi:hypothetical protein